MGPSGRGLVRLPLILLTFALSLSACGAPSGRPSEAELAVALYEQDVRGKAGGISVVNCQARALRASVLSNEALWAFAGKADHQLSKEEKALLDEGGKTWQKLQICRQNH